VSRISSYIQPAVLQKHARHYRTGEPIPEPLLEKMFRANKFGQGFATIEYSACALVDVALHQLTDVTGKDKAVAQALRDGIRACSALLDFVILFLCLTV
jgi:Zn-dependent oligopeptidase